MPCDIVQISSKLSNHHSQLYLIQQSLILKIAYPNKITQSLNLSYIIKTPKYNPLMQSQDKQITSPHSFLQSGLQPYICKLLSHNSYNKPTPIQYHSIRNAIDHQQCSLVCRAKSGTGKTLAYIGVMLYRLCCVKELENKTYCIVVSPTRELAVQIYQTLKLLLDSATNVKAATQQQKHTKQILLNLTPMLTIGGLSFEDDRKKYREHACHILICTVGRLWQLFRNNIIILNKDLTIVYDEGDKLFNKIDEKLAKVLKFVERGRWFIYSATYDRKVMLSLFNIKVKKWLYVQTGLKGGQLEVVVTDKLEDRLLQEQKQQLSVQNAVKQEKQDSLLQNSDNLTLQNIKKYQIILPENTNESHLDQKLTMLSQLLKNLHYQKCLIFIEKKSFLEQISQYLSSAQFQHILIHGSLTQAARFRMMNRINDTKIILASDLLARGIDIKLDLVILFDVRQCDTFWHRIGRTGRYGRTGVAISLQKVQNGQDKWSQYDEKQVNGILEGIDEYDKKQWYGGHMTEIGKWQDYDLNKQEQNNYKYFEEQNYEQTIKQISNIEQKNKNITNKTNKQQSSLSPILNQIQPKSSSKLDKILSEIGSKSELQEFIKNRILKCSKCLGLIEGTTQLTGYQFQILKYIQQQ